MRRSGAKPTFGIDDPCDVELWTTGLKLATDLGMTAHTEDLTVRRLSLKYRDMIRISTSIPALRRMGLILQYHW